MDLLLILTYSAFCIAIFKIFKIPLNKWSVPTAVLGGIFLIGSLILLMNFNHPYSEMSRQYFVTTPIVPNVTGQVIEVPVKGNKLLNKGDVLFRLDPEPFQNKIDSIKARLVGAQADYQRAKILLSRKAGSKRDLDIANAKANDLKAQLAQANYELKQTIVRAPDKGYVVQVALRPGMRAASLPLRPVMVFVSGEGHYLIGWFRQNSLLRLKVGYEAEVAFDGIPGTVFSGEIQMVMPALAEGQVQPSGNLINPYMAPRPGRIPVLINITDPRYEAFADQIPGGAYAQVAVYSDHFSHVAIMRKILLRMAAWLNYLFPFH
ncbi:MAG: HlyD family secretion protein [Pseudomonadales bacterium]|nr:HlyD family secretion protein [Pseudomonadales bacterium]NRA16698.1 HlyD family secretion protein [Oceanospirillaceae bacterium]